MRLWRSRNRFRWRRVPDCNAQCLQDSNKSVPDSCGGGEAEADSDYDNKYPPRPCKHSGRQLRLWRSRNRFRQQRGTILQRPVPQVFDKSVPGSCCVGVVETDSDSDGFPDRVTVNRRRPVWTSTQTRYNDRSLECRDEHPNDIHNTVPGLCGCGELDTNWTRTPTATRYHRPVRTRL
jgi:hypothetical protein